MQVIIPQQLKILNDSVPEDEAPLWDSTLPYLIGERVIDDHVVYEAVQKTTNKRPKDNCGSDGAPWRLISVTNKYACIDTQNFTQTIAPENVTELVIEVPFQRPATAVGLLNMSATSVVVTLRDDTEEIIWASGKISLLEDSASWWDYWFGRFIFKGDIIVDNIPPVSGKLTIEFYGGRPAVGNIIVGEQALIGDTQYGIRTGFIDYSTNATDAFGNEILIRRQAAKRGSFEVYIPLNSLDLAAKTITSLRATRTLWRGDNGAGIESAIIFGTVREAEFGVDEPSGGTLNLDIRGGI